MVLADTGSPDFDLVEEISNLQIKGSILNLCQPLRSLAQTSHTFQFDAGCSTLQEPNSVTQLESAQTPEKGITDMNYSSS